MVEEWSKMRLDEFVSKFHARAKAFTIGHPLENPFMGPLIDEGSVDRYLKFIGIATREGAELVMRGKVLEQKYRGNYVTPTISWVKEGGLEHAKKSVFQQTEFFAPAVAVMSAGSVDEAIELANVTQYGLVASVFTQDRGIYDHFLTALEFGLVNWNKSTVGASSRLPFGGFKKSGNHFPSAVMATRYCVAPVASIEVTTPSKAKSGAYPGLNWD